MVLGSKTPAWLLTKKKEQYSFAFESCTEESLVPLSGVASEKL